MNSSLRIQVDAAETLIDAAAAMILDAAQAMHDAGDDLGRQALEELSVKILYEFGQIRERLGLPVSGKAA